LSGWEGAERGEGKTEVRGPKEKRTHHEKFDLEKKKKLGKFWREESEKGRSTGGAVAGEYRFKKRSTVLILRNINESRKVILLQKSVTSPKGGRDKLTGWGTGRSRERLLSPINWRCS